MLDLSRKHDIGQNVQYIYKLFHLDFYMLKRKSYIQELANYIKKNLKKGYTKDSLKWALIGQGHSKLEVEKALRKAEDDLAHEAPVLSTKPEIKYEVVEPREYSKKEEKKSFWKKWFG